MPPKSYQSLLDLKLVTDAVGQRGKVGKNITELKDKKERNGTGFAKSVGEESSTKIGMFIFTSGRIQILNYTTCEKN